MRTGATTRPHTPRSAWRTCVVTTLAWGCLAGFGALHAAAAAVAAADPLVAAAGDYGCDPLDPHYNNLDGLLVPPTCQQRATSNLLVDGGFGDVLALGDQHYCGSLTEYQQAYDPTWGRVKSITHPVPGNHDYLTAGGSTPTTGCDATNAGAAGYFSYFGAAAGNAGQGWYSFDIGAWHVIALNSNCGNVGGCTAASPQGIWLAADLAANRDRCTLAYWHIPLFSSGGRAAQNGYWFWQALYAAHADLVLDGHDHIYERFDPQDPNGLADPNGIREFIVGTGGANHTSIAAIAGNSVVRDTTTFGVLALSLHATGYSWEFRPAAGLGTFTDGGSASCHSATGGPSASASTSSSASSSAGASTSPSPSASPTAAGTAPAGPATFTPVADSYVDASAPTATRGTATTLRVDASPVVRTFLRFSVAGLGAPVTSATLRVYANSIQSTGWDACPVADCTWSETAISDANAPPFGAIKLGSSGRIAAAGWTSVNVTAAVTGNGAISFGLSTTSATALSLSSREGANPPQLVIVAGAAPTLQPTALPTASPVPTASPPPPPATTRTPVVSPSPTARSLPGTVSIVPSADSYVDASAPASTHGSATTLRLDGSPLVRTFLRFAVTGITGSVTSASLRIYANSAQSTGFDVYRVADSTWSEGTISDASAPPFGVKLESSGRIAAGTWTSVDVTAAVTGNGTINLGLSTTNATAISLSSREGANPPQLVIAFTGTQSAAVVPPNLPGLPLIWPALGLPMLAPVLVQFRRRPMGRAV
jgi:acid phosphatase type 7